MLVSSLAMGQMPYNPDSNGDDLIGATDLISVLGLYNTLMVDSSLTCSYEGTELESLIIGLFDETIILDSVYIEYLLIDTLTYYPVGCPEPVSIPTVLDRSYVYTEFGGNFAVNDDPLETKILMSTQQYLGFTRYFILSYAPRNGHFYFGFDDLEVGISTNTPGYSSWGLGSCDNATYSLPFPEHWTLDSNGFQVDWCQEGFLTACDHFRIIPFWHEAE